MMSARHEMTRESRRVNSKDQSVANADVVMGVCTRPEGMVKAKPKVRTNDLGLNGERDGELAGKRFVAAALCSAKGSVAFLLVREVVALRGAGADVGQAWGACGGRWRQKI